MARARSKHAAGAARFCFGRVAWLCAGVLASVGSVYAESDTTVVTIVPMGTAVQDAPRAPHVRPAEPQSGGSTVPTVSYRQHSDQELTALTAQWDDLNDAQRSALLREVKLRMAQNRGPERGLSIRTQRRYGRVVRDGRVIRFETRQIVRVTPGGSGTRGYGHGFERRQELTGDHGFLDQRPDGRTAANPFPLRDAPVRVNGTGANPVFEPASSGGPAQPSLHR